MRDSDGDGAPARLPPLAELLLLQRLSKPGRAAAVTLVAALAVGWGFAALALHEHELHVHPAGSGLGPLGPIFEAAASPLTAWPGWVAAAILGLSALRLRRGPVEPPAGRGDAARLSAAEIRRGLRREYTLARLILVVVSVLALADVARLAVSGIAALLDVAGAGDGLPWMGVEAGGLLAAGTILGAWVLTFREQIDRLGALPAVRRAGRRRARAR